MHHIGFESEGVLWPGVSEFQIQSIENCCGIADKDIEPGEEKFILVENQFVRLRREGPADGFFTVPGRSSQTKAATPSPTGDQFVPLHS